MPADENVDSEEGPDWLSHEDNDLTSKKEESVYLHTHTHNRQPFNGLLFRLPG